MSGFHEGFILNNQIFYPLNHSIYGQKAGVTVETTTLCVLKGCICNHFKKFRKIDKVSSLIENDYIALLGKDNRILNIVEILPWAYFVDISYKTQLLHS